MASFRKRGKTWQFRIRLKGAGGEWKEVSKGGFSTKKEAQQAAIELEVLMNKGVNIKPDKNRTVGEFILYWLDKEVKDRVDKRTYFNYKRLMNARVIPYIGDIILKDLTLFHGQELVDKLKEENLSFRYINSLITTTKSALKDAVEWEMITHNPFQKLKRLRVPKEKKKTWDMKELNRFFRFSKLEGVYYYVFLLIGYTGMRRGEALGLRWQDINLETGKINIEQILVNDEEGFRFKEPKTDTAMRTILVDKTVCKELKKLRARQNEYRLALGQAYQDYDLLFAHDDGLPLHPRTTLGAFHRIREKAELSNLNIHGLRHTFATILLEMDEHPKIVSEILGHTSTAFTMDIYSHVNTKMQKATMDRFGEEMKKSN